MKVFPIETPLDGEQVVGVEPELKRLVDVDKVWRKRVNHFTGRNLTHTALSSEQAGRSGHVTALGQLLSTGVIDGLVVDLATELSGSSRTDYLHVGSGSGIDSQGEIVTLNRPLRVRLRDIPVYAAATDLNSASAEGSDDTTSSSGSGNGETTSDTGTEGILARKLGPELGQAIEQGLTLPPVAILVLQPVQIEMNLERQEDPCDLDLQQYAYENWQLVDGARLVLYCWPEEVLGLPGGMGDDDWRNRIAHALFSFENNLGTEERLPWMEIGVPLAVIGFNETWQPLFIDRNAVVRAGGKRRRAPSLLTNNGNRFLWQARFQQFNEHLVDLLSDLPETSDPVFSAAAGMRFLPPVGILPVDFFDLATKKQHFFPLSYQVEALAIPYEQLDLVVQESAGLQPFDFNRADRVQALVPVPQVYFEPGLLDTEVIDVEFDATVAAFVSDRNELLGRRLELRRKTSRLRQIMSGKPIDFPYPDPSAVDPDELAAPFESAPVDFAAQWRYLAGTTEPPETWFTDSFDDSSWDLGTGGFGYNSAAVETQLENMPGSYVSLYTRIKFNIDELDDTRSYRLEVLTSGGFVAYINGSEILRDNLSASSSDATADKQLSAELRVFEIDQLELVEGNNLFALQAHAPALNADSFIIAARLVEKRYVDQIESDDYGLTPLIDGEAPLLEDAEPVYQAADLESLKTYFNGRTYTDDEGDEKRIWALDEIGKFEQIESDGLQEFIDFLQEKVNKANDKVDFGFVRLQTDIYRIRQFILGNEEATKLATSPVLAGIAKGETAVATKEEISKVASLLSLQTKTQPAVASETESGDGSDGGTPEKETLSGISPKARSGQVYLSGGLSGEDSQAVEIALKGTESASKDASIELLARDAGLISGQKQIIQEQTKSEGLLLATAKEIEEQSFIIGTYPTFRNVTVGERLEQPVTNQAVDAGRAAKAETISNIQSTGLSMDGIKVPGFKDETGKETLLKFNEINLDDILSGKHDPADIEDEASRFNAGVRSLENASSLLRLTEGRIKAYKLLIEQCSSTLQKLRVTRANIDGRLKQIEDDLAEARHDVSVSRALRAEEQERIDGINQRRQGVLAEHVPFLMFRRPRLSDTWLDVPVVSLNPDLSEIPLPECDVDEDEIPEEIAALMDEIKDAPVRWFRFADKLMSRINRPADLSSLIKSARTRARIRKTRHRLVTRQYEGLNLLAAGIDKSIKSFSRIIDTQRKQVADIDLVAFSRFGWEESRKRATKVISLGDVIDGNHGRMGASRQAAQELERLSHASLCLYLQFVQVLPSIRLDWAERLSQYDAPVNLRNLYSLPRWSEIEFIERNQIQRIVDGMYGRIDASYSDASDMISELVRVAILLASHAPVNKLITGIVPEPKTVKPGSIIDVVADLTRVRIGMNLSLVAGRNSVARGRIKDIVGGKIKTEITSTFQASVKIEKNTRVQIGEPRVTGGKSYQRSRFIFRR